MKHQPSKRTKLPKAVIAEYFTLNDQRQAIEQKQADLVRIALKVMGVTLADGQYRIAPDGVIEVVPPPKLVKRRVSEVG